MKNTDKETAFIIKFTVCFVVAAIVLIGAGYAAITVIGSIDFSGKTSPPTPVPTPSPTIDPQTTPDPTAKIIVPATPTPVPTPVPSRYSVYVNYLGDVSSRTYAISYTLGKNAQGKLSDPIDMGLVRFSLWNSGSVRQENTYSQLINNGASWSGSDGDAILEDGEAFSFVVSYYALDISPDTESRVTFFAGDETVKTTTLPVLVNPVITEEPPDPCVTPTLDPFNPFYGYD
ncbi:MAG: hypothetical protein WBZ29_03595 [Methanocella sp.]